MDNINKIFTPIVKDIIERESRKTKNAIFVFLGIKDYVNVEEFKENIIDFETFCKEGNKSVFDRTWFFKTFTALGNNARPFSILSFAQLSYLIDYLDPEFFKDRIILLKDNLRTLFPLPKDLYIEHSGEENIEMRPEDMPVYQAEQFKIGSNFFYSAKMPIVEFKEIPFFTQTKELKDSIKENGREVIDISTNSYAIDWFLNNCIVQRSFNKRIIVKFFEKQPLSKDMLLQLEKLNYLLGLYKGEVYRLNEKAINEEYKPSTETIELLKKYWGKNASFRKLKVYKNPDSSKEIVPISQGLIVDTIINEYKKAQISNKDVRDLFLTAPTGAGKSLLFQLPAFYVSGEGDVTIVVAPLIALMKDQVNQIRRERGYEKVQYLNSELTLLDRDKVIESCKNGETDILYMSPELLLSYDISFFIGDRKLGLLVIDEAHLITTWGRDFRVDYWFLGNYISKIRKYHEWIFPMVAVTATAIYGGGNDMVFDGANSLCMHNPHYFIGEVKRDNITFVIDNHDKILSHFDAEKEKQTVKFIEDVNSLNIKTIVYAPYRRHIEKLKALLEKDDKGEIAVSYHSGMSQDEKELAYRKFRGNEVKVMISTKAFGMGVDIPDIQVVYHHAPSGLLPDYVQEIGRAARKPEIQGFAALSYSEDDKRYSNQLFGMSSLKQYQLREVLKKVYSIFKANGSKRNMLVSTNDFGYIFNDADDLDQKVATALMMLEKNYLAKVRFNVLIARPKKLFVKVYARTDSLGLELLKKKFPGDFKFLYSINSQYHILQLDLDKIWNDHYSDKSFPLIKRDFYKKQLLKDEGIDLTPQVKVTYTVEDYKNASLRLTELLNALQLAFGKLRGKFFTKDEFEEELKKLLPYFKDIEKVSKFVLNSYSGRQIGPNKIEDNAFLQKRRSNIQEEYRVFGNSYMNKFSTIKKHFAKLYLNSEDMTQSRFVTADDDLLMNYIRLGSLLEILNLGTYETTGGEDPMIFIRINDPLRIKHDAYDNKYSNEMLTRIRKRHEINCDIFDHFFLHSFSNEERWNFIEDFFLGATNDELFEKYPGGERNHTDIIQYIKVHCNDVQHEVNEEGCSMDSNIFTAKDNAFYFDNNLLTIDKQTMKVSKWISIDPVSFDKERRKHNLRIAPNWFNLLINKLHIEHFEYYRDVMGLKLQIEFPGYEDEIEAQIPYDEQPVKFYKWYRKNPNKVYLSKIDYIKLLLKVNKLNPKALLKSDRTILENKKL